MPAAVRFPRSARLRRPPEFQAAFAEGRRLTGTCFRLHARLADQGEARLGVSVSRRVDPHAVGRNRIKRQARESFRAHRGTLAPGDYVLVAQAAAARASGAELRAELARLWQRAASLKPAPAAGTMPASASAPTEPPRS